MNKTYRKPIIAVIGAGAAGVMATLRGVLNNDQVLLFTGNAKTKKKSRAQWVRKVENVPGLMNLKHGIKDSNKQTIEFIQEGPFAKNLTLINNRTIEDIQKVGEDFILTDDKGETYHVNYVVIATGVMDKQPEIEGTIKTIFPYANVQAVDYCIRCDGHHALGKEVALIGHEESAAWVAIMLHERYAPFHITIMTDGKEPQFGEEVQKLLKAYHIDVNTKGLDGIRGDKKSGVLEGFYFCDGSYVPADFAFVSLGMIVYNDLAVKLGVDTDQRGFVTTDEKGQSSLENLYIAGDLRANTKKQIYTAWDSAVDALDDINQKIRKQFRQYTLAKGA